jgi:chromosome segregation ATPase
MVTHDDVKQLEEKIENDHQTIVKDLKDEITRKTASISLNLQEISRHNKSIIGLTSEKGLLQLEVQELKTALVQKDETILSMRTGFKEALTYPHNALKKKCEEFNALKPQFEEVKLENTQLKQEIETLKPQFEEVKLENTQLKQEIEALKTALKVYIAIMILI